MQFRIRVPRPSAPDQLGHALDRYRPDLEPHDASPPRSDATAVTWRPVTATATRAGEVNDTEHGVDRSPGRVWRGGGSGVVITG